MCRLSRRLVAVRRPLGLFSFLAIPAVLAGGCSPGSDAPAEGDAPTVTVVLPVVRPVTDYVWATGRTAAVESVEIRPRVTGYIQRMRVLLEDKPLLEAIRASVPGYMHLVKLDPSGQVGFVEGEEVAEGQTLFIIDPRPFKAEYDRVAAQIQVREANLKYREAELVRAGPLVEKGVMSRSEFDSTAAARDEAAAAVNAARKDLENARLNLEFTDVKSPVTGRVSRAEQTAGNLATADGTLLTTVVTVDPVYLYFSVDERTILDIQQAVREGKIEATSEREIPVFMQLANESGYPHRGLIDFFDNRIDGATGAILLRGVFANPKPPGGARPLLAGLFARVRIPVSSRHDAVLLPERALLADLNQKYVLVVDAEDAVQHRVVDPGLREGNLRVIAKGVGPQDRVIVGGQQLVRPKMKVRVEVRPAESPQSPAPPDGGESAAGKGPVDE